MEHVAVGKLLPNLKVTVGNDEASSEEKSFDKTELISDNSGGEQNIKIVRSWMNSLQNPKVYKNKGGAFTTGLDLLSESNTEKLDKRAERFGIEKEDSSVAESISSLYESMGVDIENKNSAKMKNIRIDALHLRGVNELNTNDIFQYFQDYGPASVEWINDFSCNVVWMDEATCARALLGISRPLKAPKPPTVKEEEKESTQLDSSEQSKSSNLDDNTEGPVDASKEESPMETDDVEQTQSCSSGDESPSLDIPVPPGCWRLGTPHSKAKSILLRFATKDDKKLPGAEKRSTFYQKYGNPNYGGLRGLISGSRKRKMQAATNKRAVEIGSTKSEEPAEDSSDRVDAPVPKPRLPRMRMYADDEELKTKSSRFKSIQSEKPSVHSRLGMKYTKDDLCHLGSYDREREDRNRPFFSDEEEEERDRPLLGDWEREVKNRLFFSNSEREKRTRPFFSDREREGRTRPYANDDSYNRTKAYSAAGRTSGWDRKKNVAPHNQEDLRTKIKKLKTESGDVSKHRSPLCVD